MGKLLNVFGGIVLILVALGLLFWGFGGDLNNLGVPSKWFLPAMITLIAGAIPPMLGLLGLILLFIGMEEMKSESAAPLEPAAPVAPIEEKKEHVYEIHGKKKKR